MRWRWRAVVCAARLLWLDSNNNSVFFCVGKAGAATMIATCHIVHLHIHCI
jgi:hypothetical protein